MEFFIAERAITELKIPCPFLEKDECMVYKARPLLCRTYAVEDSPLECAKNPFRNISEKAKKVLKKHYGSFLKLEPIVRQRPLVYAVSEKLNVTEPLKPIVMGAYLMSSRISNK